MCESIGMVRHWHNMDLAICRARYRFRKKLPNFCNGDSTLLPAWARRTRWLWRTRRWRSRWFGIRIRLSATTGTCTSLRAIWATAHRQRTGTATTAAIAAAAAALIATGTTTNCRDWNHRIATGRTIHAVERRRRRRSTQHAIGANIATVNANLAIERVAAPACRGCRRSRRAALGFAAQPCC